MRFLFIFALSLQTVFHCAPVTKHFKNLAVQLENASCDCSISMKIQGSDCQGKGMCNENCSGSGNIQIEMFYLGVAVHSGNLVVSKCTLGQDRAEGLAAAPRNFIDKIKGWPWAGQQLLLRGAKLIITVVINLLLNIGHYDW